MAIRRHITVMDARGERRRVPYEPGGYAIAGPKAHTPEASLRLIRRRLTLDRARSSKRPDILLAIVALIFAGFAVRAALEDPTRERIGFLVVGTTVLIVAGLCRRLLISLGLRRLAAAAAGNLDVCPACGYELAGLKPEPDGITVCPECSAAWQLPFFPASSQSRG